MKSPIFPWVACVVLAVVGCRHLAPVTAQVQTSQQLSYLAFVKAEMEKVWPTNRTVNIVCHGHSVPSGYYKTPEVRTFDAYPMLLHRALSDHYPHAVVNVIVTAIGGEASETGAARFERDVLSLRPDVVTIDYALNDRGLGLQRAEVAWRKMIEQAQARGVKVILLTPTPDTRSNNEDPNDPISQHAEQVRRLAREYNVGLVDSLELFRRKMKAGMPLKDLMSHVNHPNRVGHQMVADELMKWFWREKMVVGDGFEPSKA